MLTYYVIESKGDASELMSQPICTSVEQLPNWNNENKDKKKVDTSKLKVGMEIKNYTELCKLLGEQPVSGNAKESQLHRWSLNFQWEKTSRKQKITITKIYLRPIPDLVPERSTFAKIMQLIIIRLLAYMADDTYYFFNNHFWVKTGMVAKEFKKINTDKDGISHYFGEGNKYSLIDPETAQSFFEIANAKLREATRTALKTLDNSGLIHYRQEYCVKTTPWKSRGGFRTATKEEENLIVEAEQHALEELKTISKFYALSKVGNIYRKKVNDYIHNKNSGLHGGTQWIAIVYHRPPNSYLNRVIDQIVRSLRKTGYINENNEDYLDDEMLGYLSKLALNDMVISKMINEAKRQHEKALQRIKKDGFNSAKSVYDYNRMMTNSSVRFVSDCIYLADTLVKLNENPRVIDYEESVEEDMDSVFEELDDLNFV